MSQFPHQKLKKLENVGSCPLQVEAMEELVKELRKEKRPRTGPGNLSESVQGVQAAAEDMVEDRGESPLTEAQERAATEAVRSTLVDVNPGKKHMSSGRSTCPVNERLQSVLLSPRI